MKALMSGGGKWSFGSLMDLEIPGQRFPGGKVNGGDGVIGGNFPAFLPKEVHNIKDPFARTLARRIQRLPVQVGSPESCIMSSCIKPVLRSDKEPVVLLHCFDSSCLEWRRAYPLLEDAGLETWAIDILGWGFSDLERRPPCDAASKRAHLYQLWKSYIKRPMILVGPSLGAAVAIDFTVNHPEAVHKLVLMNASVYGEGTGLMKKLPKLVAYGGVSLLKSVPLRTYANLKCFHGLPLSTCLDWANVGRLHCLLPWWEDSMVSFMLSGGYNVIDQIKKRSANAIFDAIFTMGHPETVSLCFGTGVNKRTLVILGLRDKLISSGVAMRLCKELPNAISRKIPNSGHLPHVDEPHSVAKLIADFVRDGGCSDEDSLCDLNI